MNGRMALVQPLFIMELPFALLVATPLMHRLLPRAGWWAVAGVVGVVGGLALVLVSAAPSGATGLAAMVRWMPTPALCLGAMATAVVEELPRQDRR